MEELRKEFEEYTGQNYLEETQEGQHRSHQFRPSYVKFLEQKLSKQVTEEEFRKFVFDIAKQIPDDFDESTYICNEIFSHYILIPKE